MQNKANTHSCVPLCHCLPTDLPSTGSSSDATNGHDINFQCQYCPFSHSIYIHQNPEVHSEGLILESNPATNYILYQNSTRKQISSSKV